MPDESLNATSNLLTKLVPDNFSDFKMPNNQFNPMNQNFNQNLIGNFQNFTPNMGQNMMGGSQPFSNPNPINIPPNHSSSAG